MIQITNNIEISAIGGQLARGDAQIRAHGDDNYIITDAANRLISVAKSARPSWAQYIRGGRRGRPRLQEPSERITLYLPASTAKRVPTPRQAWIKRVIDERLMIGGAA